MLGYNKIVKLDRKNLLVTVESGVTWKDLAVFLDQEGLATQTEQSSNIFSIGGSVSTNVHGRDVHGPLINSIHEIKYINSLGIEQITNRKENEDQFRAIVGGYGGLGVITEVTLKVEKNYLYEARSVQDVTVNDYVDYIEKLSQKPTDRMHYGRVNISGKNRFTKMSYVEWFPVSEKMEAPDWSGWKLDLVEKNKLVSSFIMNLMRYRPTSNLGKYVKDFMDKIFGLPKTGVHKTKNNIMNNPVQFLFDDFYNQKQSVDILQEYFIPKESLAGFLENLKNTTNSYQLDLKNGDLVRYDGSKWTQELIQSAQDLGGSFYWPYHRWWNENQIVHNQKDNIKQYFQIKDEADPENIFESDFIYHLRKVSK